MIACLYLKLSSLLNEGVCLNHRQRKFWGEVSLFCSGSSPGHAAGTQRMSSAPSLQIISLSTACLFYIASLCSLESGRLLVGQSNSCRRLKVTDKESKGHNDQYGVSLALGGKREVSKIELPRGKCSVHQLQPFSFHQRKATSCLSVRRSSKETKRYLKGVI